MLAINPDGELYPCLRYMPSSLGMNQEPFILGTIKEGIGKTEQTKQRIKLLQTITASS
jgi:radical SAM protein with 4Fe4S-binding SPASM domain